MIKTNDLQDQDFQISVSRTSWGRDSSLELQACFLLPNKYITDRSPSM